MPSVPGITKDYYGYLKTVAYLFFFYAAVFIPFPFYLFSFQSEISHFIFADFIQLLLEGWGILLKKSEISSDSLSLYVLILLIFLLAILTAFVLSFFKKWKDNKEQIFKMMRLCFTFYLSMQLLKYGFDKLFKGQFYLPEPNTLYTPLGQISKDLLFWSTMGSSYSYNIFMGLLEVIPAIFLLFKKTRIIGLLLIVPVLMNIVAINFFFDISVKIYSLFLLSLALFLLSPFLKKLYDFFINEKTVSLKTSDSFNAQKLFIRTSLKTFVIGLIFVEALFPYLSNWNFNDDNIPRPYLHGAYEIQNIYKEGEEVSNNVLSFKRVFIHRKGYLIFQNEQDEMQDFKLKVDTIQQQFLLSNYDQKQNALNFNYHEKDSLLELEYIKDDVRYRLIFSRLDWRELPLLKNDFHWFVEEVE